MSYMQVKLALEIEEKLPWIRRRVKKTRYCIEKNLNLGWRRSFQFMRSGFHDLEMKFHQIKIDDKLSDLWQGIEVKYTARNGY